MCDRVGLRVGVVRVQDGTTMDKILTDSILLSPLSTMASSANVSNARVGGGDDYATR